MHDSADGFKIDKDASSNGKLKVTASAAAASPALRRARATPARDLRNRAAASTPLRVLRGAAAMPRFTGLRAALAPRRAPHAAAARLALSAARVIA